MKNDRKMARMFEFIKLIEDASWRDLMFLSDPVALYESSLVFLEDNSVYLPNRSVIPWPALFVASRYNKKHRLPMPFRPKVNVLTDFLQQFGNRIAWRNTLSAEASRIQPLSFKRRQHARTPPCNRTIDPELTAWLSHLKSRVMFAAKSALARARSIGTIGGNRPALVDFGLDWIRNSQWQLVPADKDHAQAFVHRDLLLEVEAGIFAKRWYEEIEEPDIPTDLVKRARKLIWRIGRFHVALSDCDDDDDSWLQCMRRPLGGKKVAKLKLLCKTHKAAGQVAFRNVHAISNYALSGISRCLRGRLDPCLKMWPHILFQTSDLLASPKNVFVFVFERLRHPQAQPQIGTLPAEENYAEPKRVNNFRGLKPDYEIYN